MLYNKLESTPNASSEICLKNENQDEGQCSDQSSIIHHGGKKKLTIE